jgi:uncharacterized protein YgiM (DUF1202 family)
MSHQSPRRWLRLTLVALFALTLLGTFPAATPAAAKGTSIQPLRGSTGGGTIQYARMTCDNAWMRDVPGGSYYIVYVRSGSWVDFHGRDGAWSLVSYAGYTGWILNTALCS